MEAALEVASHLRPDDRREVEEGHGVDVLQSLIYSARKGNSVWFEVPNGKTAGVAGVEPDGLIWMLCTEAIYDYPVTFAREAKRFVDSRTEPLLWNVVDERNKVHLKLLRFMGFKFLRKIFHGPKQLSFIEFARVCRSRS